jgi:hypothetical protein
VIAFTVIFAAAALKVQAILLAIPHRPPRVANSLSPTRKVGWPQGLALLRLREGQRRPAEPVGGDQLVL